MILVDNFRTVLLVGLICTGISPAFGGGNSCKDDTGNQPCPQDDTECLINREGKPAGCGSPKECPGGDPSNGAKCGGLKCCCTAGVEPCNDPEKEPLKSVICQDPFMAKKVGVPVCNAGPPTTTPPTTGGGGGDGGGGPVAMGKCKGKGLDPIECEIGQSCVFKVAGDARKLKLECWEKTQCQEVGCLDSSNCCCYVNDAEGCEAATPESAPKSSGSIIFGSFQVATLVATTLYYS